MAEQNKRVKYKFGQSELDLKNYIHNLGTNVQGYINSKNWGEGQKQEFINAYKNILAGFNDQLANNTNRFSTDDFGTITDTQGIVSNKDNDDIDPVGSEYYYDNNGNRITTDDYNLLKDKQKKNYKAFSANREVASYFNTIGNALRQYTKPSEEQNTNNFDLSKHGFLPTWTSQQNPAGGDFDTTPYIQMDQVGEDGVRQTSKRASYLREQLTNYLKDLSSYNYENTSFKDETTYRQRLQEAINGLENGYNSEDTIALNRAGINNEFLKNFFSDGTSQEQPKSELQRQAEQAAREIQERNANAQLQAVVDQNEQQKYETARNQYFTDFQKNNPFENTVKWTNVPLSYNREAMDQAAVKKFNADSTNKESVVNAIKQYINFDQLSRFIRGKEILRNKETKEDITKQHVANNLDWAAQANLFLDPGYLTTEGKSILSDGYYVIPGSEDYDKWTFLAYNPQTRQYQEQSMLLNDLLKERMAYSEYDRRNKVKKNQLGGTLGWVQENQKKANEVKEKENAQKERAKNENLTIEQVKDREKKVFEDQLGGDDWTRLASIALDLTSAGTAYIPVAGTAISAATGLASTLANFGADIFDESTTQEQMWRNLGMGLGMDVIGLIPGLGSSAKASKIAKAIHKLKPLKKGIMLALQATASRDILNTIPSFDKAFTNPKELTAEDLRQISIGLQALIGLHRGKRGSVERNRYTLTNTSASIPNKSGTQSSISVDQLKELRKQKGYDKQNEYFKNLTGGQELPKEFKHYNDPLILKPFTRPFRTGPEVSISKTTELLPNTTYSWGVYRTKTPEVPQTTQSITPQTTSQPGPSINQLRVWSKTPSWALKKGYGRDFGIREPKKNKTENKLGIEFDKKGGTLNLANVRKFQNGKNITNTTSKADWFKDMFSSDAMQKWIDAYTLNDYQKFNDLQKSWSANKKATQYVPGTTPLSWNQGVQDRQKLWEQTGTNSTIEDLVTKGIITRPGKSGDNAEEGHVDGYFGEQEFLRHGGTGDSWKGHEEELIKFQNMLKEKGLQYTLDPETGMYLMSPIEQQVRQNSGSTNLNIVEQEEEDEGGEDDSSANGYPSKSWKDIFTKVLSNPTITYGLPRALYADRTNRKITDLAQELDALQKDPFQVHRYTRSDLDAEMQGVRNYAKLRNLANTNLTSDADKQKAYQFESESKGIDYINAGKEKSNQVERQYEELAWQQEKENAANRHQTAMFNREQQWQDKYRDNLYEQAYLNKKHNIWDTLGQQFEFDVRQKLAKTEAIKDNLNRSEIHNAVMYNPNYFGANLSKEELEVWSQVLGGTNPSSLGNKLNVFTQAQKKVSQAEQNQFKKYYNIADSEWTNIPIGIIQNSETYTPNIESNKKGGKIKNNLEDIRNFQKQIKDGIKRSDKAIERLFKQVNKKNKK